METRERLGMVVAGSLAEGLTVRLDGPVSVEDIAVGRYVVVEGERIARVEAAGGARAPKAARVIDGTGKFLIPGLWDMHIHTFFGDCPDISE